MSIDINDPMYLCASSYKDMINKKVKFKVEIVSDNEIKECTIMPDVSEFKHLTGIQHLEDLIELKNLSSEKILSESLLGNITFSELKKSNNFINKYYAGYTLHDRIIMLGKYYQIMNSINDSTQNGTLIVFNWDKDKCNSDINADYLFQFKVNNLQYSYINFFFKENKDKSLYAISCFPSKHDYSKNGLSQVEILNITEQNKFNSLLQIKTTSDNKRQEVQRKLDEKKFGKHVRNIIKELKDTHKSADFHIKKMLVNKENKYSDSVLEIAKNRLHQASKTVSNDKLVCIKDCILKIETVQHLRSDILPQFNELEKARNQCVKGEEELREYEKKWTNISSMLMSDKYLTVKIWDYLIDIIEEQKNRCTNNDVKLKCQSEIDLIKEEVENRRQNQTSENHTMSISKVYR